MKKSKKDSMYAVQLWKGIDRQWYWHIVSTINGQIILTSEGYKSKSKAKKTIQNFFACRDIKYPGILYEELELI